MLTKIMEWNFRMLSLRMSILVDLLNFGTKLHGLLVYSKLKIMVQLHWFIIKKDD